MPHLDLYNLFSNMEDTVFQRLWNIDKIVSLVSIIDSLVTKPFIIDNM